MSLEQQCEAQRERMEEMKKEHLATGKETDGCGHRRRGMDLWVWQQRGGGGTDGCGHRSSRYAYLL